MTDTTQTHFSRLSTTTFYKHLNKHFFQGHISDFSFFSFPFLFFNQQMLTSVKGYPQNMASKCNVLKGVKLWV